MIKIADAANLQNERLAEAMSKSQDKPPRPPAKAAPAAATAPAAAHSQPHGLAFDLANLSGPDGEEVSFEEVCCCTVKQQRY